MNRPMTEMDMVAAVLTKCSDEWARHVSAHAEWRMRANLHFQMLENMLEKGKRFSKNDADEMRSDEYKQADKERRDAKVALEKAAMKIWEDWDEEASEKHWTFWRYFDSGRALDPICIRPANPKE